MTITDQPANVLGILYTTKRMAIDISQKSGRLARDNEYQVHYNTTNFRLSDSKGYFVDISVPTVVFNYPQIVSSAAIEFEMTDVIAMSAKVEPLTEAKHKEVMAKFYRPLTDFAAANNLSVTVAKENFSNIHRHPGGLNSFSGTDYDKNPDNPGICFPVAKGNNSPVFSSIILHRDQAEITYTEYRVANTVDDNLRYYHGDCYTYCQGYSVNLPDVFRLFSNKSGEISSSYFPSPTTKVAEIFAIFSKLVYEPDISLVLENNLSKKEFKYDKPDYAPVNYSTYKRKEAEPKPHNGKYPLFKTFIEKHSTYADELFKLKQGTFLGADIYDAYLDVEAMFKPNGLEEAPLDYVTIDDFVNDLQRDGILECYLEEYTELEQKTLFSFKSRYNY